MPLLGDKIEESRDGNRVDNVPLAMTPWAQSMKKKVTNWPSAKLKSCIFKYKC